MKNKKGLNQSPRRWHLRILARVPRHKCSPLRQSGCALLLAGYPKPQRQLAAETGSDLP